MPGRRRTIPSKLGLVRAIPYLAKQQRLTFARCGITDPLSTEDYEAHGGLKGLRRALDMALGHRQGSRRFRFARTRRRGFPTGIMEAVLARKPRRNTSSACG